MLKMLQREKHYKYRKEKTEYKRERTVSNSEVQAIVATEPQQVSIKVKHRNVSAAIWPDDGDWLKQTQTEVVKMGAE